MCRLEDALVSDATEVRTASETGGEKGVKLARFELIPTGPLAELASRFGLGAMKYENRNWERGYEWSKSFGALMRHAQAFWSGEDDDDLGDEAYRAAGMDPEAFKEIYGRIPGSSHLAAVAFHALALLEWSATHPEFDDRVKPKRDEWKPDERTQSLIRNEAAKRAQEIRRRERIRAAAAEVDNPFISAVIVPPGSSYTYETSDNTLINNHTGETMSLDGEPSPEQIQDFLRRKTPALLVENTDQAIAEALQAGLDQDQRSQ
jgi:hypothetical protein